MLLIVDPLAEEEGEAIFHVAEEKIIEGKGLVEGNIKRKQVLRMLQRVVLKKEKVPLKHLKEGEIDHTLKDFIVDQEAVVLQEDNDPLDTKNLPLTNQKAKTLLKGKLIRKDNVHAVKDVI